jgi:hypothetical protein
MRETRLTRRARAAIALYLRAGDRLAYHPMPYAFVVVRPNGHRMTYVDEWEVTMPVTERMREILKTDDPSPEPLWRPPVTAPSA